jgi:hypothetical protein
MKSNRAVQRSSYSSSVRVKSSWDTSFASSFESSSESIVGERISSESYSLVLLKFHTGYWEP